MAISKTLILRHEDNAILAVDTIEYKGKLWIVPEWLAGPTKGTEWPARIICLDGLPLVKPPLQYENLADRYLSIALSKETLEGRSITQGFVVIERPDILLRVGTDFR
jgi:hypothetical protein